MLYGRNIVLSSALVAGLIGAVQTRAVGGYLIEASTYIGGSLVDGAGAISMDAAGNFYVAGSTTSPDFPVTLGRTYAGGPDDAYVAKIDPWGRIVWVRLLGGSAGEQAAAIDVDPETGEVALTGRTTSPDFPVTRSAYQRTFGGGANDGWIARLSAEGDVTFATYHGGGELDQGRDIKFGRRGHLLAIGFTTSPRLPVMSAIQPHPAGLMDGYFVEIDEHGELEMSTYFGGSGADNPGSIAEAPDGSIYIVGGTDSSDFPITASALQGKYAGGGGGFGDAFITQFSADWHAVLYSTYFGGSGGEFGFRATVDRLGAVSISGFTTSTDLPTIRAVQPRNSGGEDAFVARVHPDGKSLLYSTYLGGSANDRSLGLSLRRGTRELLADACGAAIVAGRTTSQNFPVTRDALQPQFGGVEDAFIAVLSASGQLLFSTFYGGPGMDFGTAVVSSPPGAIGLTVVSSSPALPEQVGALRGPQDGVIARLFAWGDARSCQ